MRKNHKVSNQKTYFSCLDIYESNATYDANRDKDQKSYSSYARKPGSTLLVRYRILEVLQESAFGFVYLAEREKKNTKYIIKEFFPHKYVTRNDKGEMILNTPLDIDSLLRFNYMQKFFMGEAANLEKISVHPHKNIIRIISVEKNRDNTNYIVYPYYNGMTLYRYMEIKERLGKYQFDKKGLDGILIPLVDAVEHLHSININHLNIKPENILIQEDGSLLLMGFESSIFFHDEDSRIFCNAYTLSYAAPEQIDRKEFSNIGCKSDIYAIGALLYKMVTGMHPPDAKERMACKAKSISYDPYMELGDKKDLLEKYGFSLVSAIDKSMRLSSKNRFRDMKSYKNALLGIVMNEALDTKKKKRNFLLYFLFLVGALFVAYMVVGKVWNIDTIEVSRTNQNTINYEENISLNDIKNMDIDNEQKSIIKKDKISSDIASGNAASKMPNIIKEETESLTNTNVKYIESKKELIETEETMSKNSINPIIKKETSVHEKNNSSAIGFGSKKEVYRSTNSIPLSGIANESDMKNENEIEFVDPFDILKAYGMKRDADNQKRKNAIRKNIEVGKNQKMQSNIIVKPEKRVKEILKKRKKRVLRKKKTKKSVHIQRKKSIKKKGTAVKYSEFVWYCKAIGGNIKESARDSNKVKSKNIALGKCRRRAGAQTRCRILSCFLVR